MKTNVNKITTIDSLINGTKYKFDDVLNHINWLQAKFGRSLNSATGAYDKQRTRASCSLITNAGIKFYPTKADIDRDSCNHYALQRAQLQFI